MFSEMILILFQAALSGIAEMFFFSLKPVIMTARMSRCRFVNKFVRVRPSFRLDQSLRLDTPHSISQCHSLRSKN